MNKTTDTLAVANTIKAQIGNRALFMLGAHEIGGTPNALAFRIRGSKAFNYIRVTLDPCDTYTVKFHKLFGGTIIATKVIDGVYSDGLHQVIELNTGLLCSL